MVDGKTEAMARQLEAAQAITHVGSWEWNLATGIVAWSDELYRIYGLEPRSKIITLDVFLSALVPEDRDRIQGEIQAAMARGGRFAYRECIARPDGSRRILDTIGEVLADADGKATGLIGTCRDVTEEAEVAKLRHRTARIHECERHALERLANGAPLEEVLDVLVLLIEELNPGCIASVLLLDMQGKKLWHGSAPSLPAEYNSAIDGVEIGPRAGSCGTAAYRKEPVFVTDLTTDPLWISYRHIAEPHGFRACWSFPIFASNGTVMGTFAVYYREPRSPDPASIEPVQRATHVASIAIERCNLDDQMHALSARIEAVREEERTNIAREIHDELGQALTALKLDIGWVARRSQGEVATKLADMSRASDELINSVRRISSELRPGILDAIGLPAAIEWQADETSRRSNITVEVTSHVGDLNLERSLTTTVFRIFQEALTNVVRHAQATRIDVKLWLERGNLRLEIADDGIGVPEIAPRTSALGLLGMRERARRVGGECTVRRREPQGTVVALSVPLRFPAARDHDEELGA
jgi:PAS domain S-box-containing protein